MKSRIRVYITLFAAATMMVSCKAHHCVQEETVSEEIAIDTGPIYLFSLSFISRGEGIDKLAMDSVEAYLQPLEEMNVISVDRIAWGREGEVDYCVGSILLGDWQIGKLTDKFNSFALRNELLFFSTEGCREQR